MNPVKKLGCRVYQTAFRAALPILPYREPKIYHTVTELVPMLQENQITSVQLVTDKGIRGAGLTRKLETALEEGGIHCAVYDDTRANPTVQNVEEARELYLAEDCRALIAFGGGSAIDCAKALGARIANPKKSLNQMKGILRVRRRLPPLIAIPTTAGTGSEVTLAAVITDGETRHKYPINDFPLIPTYAVHDPEVTYSLPPHLTATTGMDALTHAVEAYIGRSTSRETRGLALEAVGLIFGNIEQAYRDGRNREARANMLRASYAAGISFSKSYVGYVHAVAHSLGGEYNIPHGLANSVLLPYVLEAYGAAIHQKLHALAVAAGIADEAESHETGARKFIAAIREMNHRMGIPQKLPGIREEDIPRLAKYAEREANPLYPVPVLMTAKELEAFYYQVADWSKENED